jgi:transposase
MPSSSQRAPLHLTEQQKAQLKQLSGSRTSSVREVQRAQALLQYVEGRSISAISRQLRISRPSLYKCIDRALAAGVEVALKDKYHRPKAPVISAEAKAWVLHLACSKPTEHGYAAEVWSLSALAQHARQQGPAAGHRSLSQAAKATIQRILKTHPVQPHRQRYYLERRDPQFEARMHEVLVVYQEVALDQEKGPQTGKQVTVSVDEKPGIQALRNLAPDLPPQPGQHPHWARDHEYKRLGTLSLLAALDLHTGHVTAQVHPRHRSVEFIALLKQLDAYYPQDHTIRLILDHHSAHISKQTLSYLATRPNRFVYVHTPKHGSWLNLIETLFGKMARTFLKRIRVQSVQELKQRILKGVAEINAAPVIHRWKKFDFAESHM